MLNMDPEEMRRALDLLAAGEERVFELRIPKARPPGYKSTVAVSGYFDDADKLVEAVQQSERRGARAEAVYITLNPVNHALLSRAANRARVVGKDESTADRDVLRIRWVPVDLDAIRPSRISSTDKEHEEALERARTVREHLRGEGWPEPIFADSGNGGHLLYMVDLPTDQAPLVKRCLQALAVRFNDQHVTVDTGNFNPSRIWKLYGSVAAKGDDLPDRPHRLARIIDAGGAATVAAELLEVLAATAPADPGPATTKGRSRRTEDAGLWLEAHGLEPQAPIDWAGGKLWRFVCPWNGDHGHTAYVVQFPNGGIDHGCHHASCADKKWKDLRELREPSPTAPDTAQLRAEIEPLLGRAKETGNPAHAFQAARLLAQLPAAEMGPLKASFKTALGDKLNLNELARAIAEARQEEPNAARQEQDIYAYELGDRILEEAHFARDEGGRLYMYRGGVYRSRQPNAERFVLDRVEALVTELGKQDCWDPRLAKAVVEWVLGAAPDLLEHPPTDSINLANGILDLTTMELASHSPELLLSIQIPVNYDPAATCPAIDDFLAEVLPADSIELAWEILGDSLTPDRSIQKAILLIGEGGGGKSIFLALVIAFVGAENVANLSLHRLEADRFSAANLYRRLADVCPDLPSEHLTSTSLFKSITGGDRIVGEFKFKTSFSFTPYCRLLFSANHPPVSKDASKAFFDRWIVIPFDRSFRGTAQEIPRNMLLARLADPAELSGALNKALVGLRRVRTRGQFTETESGRRAMEQFQEVTDPLSIWLDRDTVIDSNAVITKTDLTTAYNRACEVAGRPAVTKESFGRALRKLRPGIQDAQRTVHGKLDWCYLGIGLKAPHQVAPDPPAGSRDSRDSRVFPYPVPHGIDPTPLRRVGGGCSVEQVKGIPVNPVNPVNRDACPRPVKFTSFDPDDCIADPDQERPC